ncbi:MAG: 4-alpha-glucanotransferase [Clostridia bacterium]|nr:4-alpha-glucanotransferase [Clostridia bacterium]
MKRSSGVLMHVSSLWGDYSVGSFGKEAFEFIDLLHESGFSFWQVLPFCMTDDCNSPYKSFSAFGANPYFIDLPTLYMKGLLTKNELDGARQSSPYLCEYDRLSRERLPLLLRASKRVGNADREKIISFCNASKALSDVCLFLALKEANNYLPWQEWTIEEYDPDIYFMWQFIQYEFFTQWKNIKDYANSKGISLIGDIPIYVALDSCDVWANRDQFLLDSNGQPTAVSGCPPDYFSEDGQLWGNPLYNWKKMKNDGYSWWQSRLNHMFSMFDAVRIDHFRGLESYWSIPAKAKTAKEGKWVKGPGRSFVDMLKKTADGRTVIAEDLGDITPAVTSLLKYSGFPGMRVFQFGFLGDKNSPHIPHNYINNCVAYTGTHDNNTLLGFIWESSEQNRKSALTYCGYDGDDWNRGCELIMRSMFSSCADIVIFPIQDIFIYGADTRMNTPGTAANNWAYRITREQLSRIDKNKYRYFNELYARI